MKTRSLVFPESEWEAPQPAKTDLTTRWTDTPLPLNLPQPLKRAIDNQASAD
jgi:hypothetical protein